MNFVTEGAEQDGKTVKKTALDPGRKVIHDLPVNSPAQEILSPSALKWPGNFTPIEYFTTDPDYQKLPRITESDPWRI